ncbi:cyclophilin-like fold protein (plasmid) [Polaromonas hydrogenivorans]|uniref:Cyclophilin-like fold protein n=3 Tax=Polaromonas hydrogenivorans TaxID=335476 RepID=A0AAU7LYL4_9BURK
MRSFSARISSQRPFAMAIGHRRTLSLLLGLLVLGGCEAGQQPAPVSHAAAAAASEKPKGSRMWMTVGERRFAITLSDNAAARELAAQLPLTLDMAELNGNEKHAELAKALPAQASRPGTIHSGDLMLYGSSTLVLFYLRFDSPYAYTRLGRVDDPVSLAQALGRGAVRVVFSSQKISN